MNRTLIERNRLLRVIGLTAILMAVGLTSACGETPTYDEIVRGAAGHSASNAQFLERLQEFSLGEKAIMDKFAMTVNSVRISDGRDTNVRAPVLPDGIFYFLVDVTLENIGDKTEFVSSRMLMNLFDSDGYTQIWTLFPDSRGSIDGRIRSGQERHGELVWEVHEGAVGLKLVFDKTAFAVGDVVIETIQARN